MFDTNVPIDYVTKDYEGFLQLMKDLIPTLLPEWTDTTESDFGIVLLQLAAYGLHVLSYYQDKYMNENFLDTARNRESVIRLCRFLGYELAIQEPATTTVTFNKYADVIDTAVTIPAKTKVSTDPLLGNVIVFETDVELIIPAGTLPGTVAVTQGETTTDEIIGIGDNSISQIITIEKENILVDALTIYTIESNVINTWTKVDDFLDSTATDRHFKAVIESNLYTKITFGNGTNGRKVATNIPIYCTYRIGGGKIGNVGVGKIMYLDADITDIETLTNTAAATGGVDFETLEVAKVLAPKNYATLQRAVTKADFCALAEGVTGVAKATLVETFNINGDINMYIVPSDYSEATFTLTNSVKETLDSVKVLNNTLNVYPTTIVNYSLVIDVTVSSSYVNDDKETEIIDYLNEMLAPGNFSHGESISLSLIAGYVHQVRGVTKAKVTAYVLDATPTEDITCTAIQFLVMDSLVVNVTGGS